MSRKAMAGLAAVALVAVSFAAVSSLTSTPALAQAAAAPAVEGKFQIDPVHSSVVYRVTHLGASAHWGLFKEPTGSIEVTADGVNLDVSVDVAKLDSANAKRDEHLRGPDFFNARQFPKLTFKSTSSQKTEAGYEVTGDLILKGVTKSITVQLNHVGVGESRGKQVVGFESEFTVNRHDFGISYGPGAIGDEVKLIVAIEALK